LLRAPGFFIIERMPKPFSVSFESPQSGWMSVRLRAGERQFVSVVSHAPYDSLRDLLGGLAALAESQRPFVVRWNAEPEEFDFEFEAAGGRATLRVLRHADHTRRTCEEVFAYSGTLAEVCLPFLYELGDLRERGETDGFEFNWRRPFPASELSRLEAALATRSSSS
jgi:hypothetical protein